jgi:hypothetical protein
LQTENTDIIRPHNNIDGANDAFPSFTASNRGQQRQVFQEPVKNEAKRAQEKFDSSMKDRLGGPITHEKVDEKQNNLFSSLSSVLNAQRQSDTDNRYTAKSTMTPKSIIVDDNPTAENKKTLSELLNLRSADSNPNPNPNPNLGQMKSSGSLPSPFAINFITRADSIPPSDSLDIDLSFDVFPHLPNILHIHSVTQKRLLIKTLINIELLSVFLLFDDNTFDIAADIISQVILLIAEI